jgi:uncharacterized membrane protein
VGRKRVEAAERERESRVAQRRRRLLPVVVLLLGAGLSCSIYLLHLYIRVHSAGGGTVESFCAVSDTLNCVTVANSSYSTFLRLPIALYGTEFFGALLVLTLYSASGAWRVRAWDSLLFLAMLPALPAAAALAYISSFKIGSVCLLCAGIQGSVVLLFVMLLVAGRKRLRALFVDGPSELVAALRSPAGAVVAVLVVGAGVSQFFWAGPLFRSHGGGPSGAWEGLPVAGLSIGPKDAPVQIEEFTDFQCPHCGDAHRIMMEMLRRYPGKIHLQHRDFPLDMACNPMLKREFHPHACRAALYARCAGRQDRYWPYEELLFENREQLFEDNLRALANRVGLDRPKLDACLADPGTMQSLQDDINEGIRRKIHGTPTLFVNGERQVGLPPAGFWEKKLGGAAR